MNRLSAILGFLTGIAIKPVVESDDVEAVGMDDTTGASDAILEEVGTFSGAGLDISTTTAGTGVVAVSVVAVARVGSWLGLGGGCVMSSGGSRGGLGFIRRCGFSVHRRF